MSATVVRLAHDHTPGILLTLKRVYHAIRKGAIKADRVAVIVTEPDGRAFVYGQGPGMRDPVVCAGMMTIGLVNTMVHVRDEPGGIAS